MSRRPLEIPLETKKPPRQPNRGGNPPPPKMVTGAAWGDASALPLPPQCAVSEPIELTDPQGIIQPFKLERVGWVGVAQKDPFAGV